MLIYVMISIQLGYCNPSFAWFSFFQFVGVEGFTTFMTDLYPSVFRRGYRREIMIGVICLICFLIGLSMVTEVRMISIIFHILIKTSLAHLQFQAFRQTFFFVSSIRRPIS